jgi:hypothetical protein
MTMKQVETIKATLMSPLRTHVDRDVHYKIVLLGLLRQQEAVRGLLALVPEFDEWLRAFCMESMQSAKRQELRSVCRRFMAVLWPKPLRPATATATDPIAVVAARSAARAEEILGL